MMVLSFFLFSFITLGTFIELQSPPVLSPPRSVVSDAHSTNSHILFPKADLSEVSTTRVGDAGTPLAKNREKIMGSSIFFGEEGVVSSQAQGHWGVKNQRSVQPRSSVGSEVLVVRKPTLLPAVNMHSSVDKEDDGYLNVNSSPKFNKNKYQDEVNYGKMCYYCTKF
jgi:hypothetical protein